MGRGSKIETSAIRFPSQRQDYARRRPELCLPESERRKYQINVSLNQAEVELLDSRRGAISRTAYLRGLLSPRSLPQHAPIPALNREAYAELARLAANLNQVSRHLNETRAGYGQAAASDLLVKNLKVVNNNIALVNKNVDALRRELIGARPPS